ncbi:MAG TPA: zinc-ribbon domain-containing protein [Pyrinomonadaceae bacterium]|nr:zinc-ribbon domain-containing protein [Pyrinomonadaceae bacterium]
MSTVQPEISKRCLSCGASVRAQAMFCPECGQPLSQAGNLEKTVASDAGVVSPEPEPGSQKNNETQSLAESDIAAIATSSGAETAGADSSSQRSAERASQDSGNSGQRRETAPKETVASATLERHRTAKARETLHRASTVAKEALEDNVKRVEKIRQVSSVVLEEAHYDPSLRFVLVALAVFLIFVILLVLSKVMG